MCDALVKELLVDKSCDRLTKESEDFCQFQQLSLPEGGRSFYAMSLFFYVADFLAMAEGVIERERMDSAEDEIYQESVFVRQMERIHQLEWR